MNKPSLLLVDDNLGFIETLADVFRERDFEVDTADGGAEAVKMCGLSRYDYVVMDVIMPGISGIEALRLIRAARPETGVILMTAFTSSQVVESARAGEALAVIGKPFDLDAVFEFFTRESAARAVALAGCGGPAPRELRASLEEAGYRVVEGETSPDAAVIDLSAGGPAIPVLKTLRERDPGLPAVVIAPAAARAEIEAAIDGRGLTFLTPPAEHRRLPCAVRLAVARRLARKLKLE